MHQVFVKRKGVFLFKALKMDSFFCPVFDAVFLDSKRKVVEIRSKIRPFVFYIAPGKAYLYVLELPPGWGLRVKVGETLEF